MTFKREIVLQVDAVLAVARQCGDDDLLSSWSFFRETRLEITAVLVRSCVEVLLGVHGHGY